MLCTSHKKFDYFRNKIFLKDLIKKTLSIKFLTRFHAVIFSLIPTVTISLHYRLYSLTKIITIYLKDAQKILLFLIIYCRNASLSKNYFRHIMHQT